MWISTIWWLSFWSAVGLCLGSFLNVIIYRLPRNQSLTDPVWSACPRCGHRIRWYDNLPVIGFLRLRGRCRDCGLPIATRYVVIELLMAILVLVLFYSFFIAQVRAGFEYQKYTTLNDLMAVNWPIFLAHVILFACLLSMSAIDIEHYWVDVRFTNVAVLCGFALHTLWTTPHIKPAWPRPADTTSFVCLAALVGLGIGWVILLCLGDNDPEPSAASPQETPEPSAPDTAAPLPSPEAEARGGGADLAQTHHSATTAESLPIPGGNEIVPQTTTASTPPPADVPPAAPSEPARLGAWLLGLLFVGLLVTMILVEEACVTIPYPLLAMIPVAAIFLLIVSESWKERASDTQIIEAIEEERLAARGMVLRELAFLLPAILLGAGAWWWCHAAPQNMARVAGVLHLEFATMAVDMLRHWQPVHGLATAASGYIIGGAIGWAVRILFTMAFGKEAFGTGDIHLLAAAGCVAGWPVAALGFILSCLLALAGVVLTLPRKKARAIPLGPWLSISFLIVVVFFDAILKSRSIAGVIDAWTLLSGGISQG